jgi:hypothetical protein
MAGSRPPLVSSDCDDGTVTGRFLTMLAAAAAITGVLVAVVLLFVGVWHLLAAVYGTVSNRARAVPLRVGLAELLAAAALVTVPFATTGIAERDDWATVTATVFSTHSRTGPTTGGTSTAGGGFVRGDSRMLFWA